MAVTQGRIQSHYSFFRVTVFSIGLSLLTIAILLTSNFPIFPLAFCCLGIFYVGGVIANSRLWLTFMPSVCVAINLAPWSGRFWLNEFDFFVLFSLAGCFLHYSIKRKTLAFPGIIPTLLVLLTLASFTTTSIVEIVSAEIGNPYLSPSFGFYVGKGVVIAFLLSCFLKQELLHSHNETLKSLALGAILAGLCAVLIILWERGTLHLLAYDWNFYGVVHSILNFETSYRATGIISDMHTGGESIDGFYLLIAPFCILGFITCKGTAFRVLAIMSIAAVGYCVVVGVTRATYLGFSVAIISYFILEIIRSHGNKNKIIELLTKQRSFAYLSVFLTTIASFKYAGFEAIFWSGSILVLALLARRLLSNNRSAYLTSYVVIGLISIYLSINGYLDSRYSDKSLLNFSVVIVLVSLHFAAVIYLIMIKPAHSIESELYALFITVILAGAVVVVTSGHQFNQRMETVSRDWDKRVEHWSNVLDTSGQGLGERLFGNGWGSFPFNNFSKNPQKLKEIGSFVIIDNDDKYLELGSGKGFNISQRISLEPEVKYSINVKAKVEKDSNLVIGLCKRNLIVFIDWPYPCIRNKLKLQASDDFMDYSIPLNGVTEYIDKNFLHLPISISLATQSEMPLIQISEVMIVDSNGKQYLQNESFSKGMDYWFFHHDLNHLFWHIKNIYLSLFYQIGLVGVGLVCLILGRFAFLVVRSKATSPINSAIMSMILAYMAFGMFGDPLDSPRVSSLFFLMLFVAGTHGVSDRGS